MFCLIFNIENPLNFDVGFPTLNYDELPIRNVVSHKTSFYRRYNKETREVSDKMNIKLFKLRLSGIIKKKDQSAISDGFIKYKLIRWNNRTGGLFYISIKSVDKYGRIEADLIDPVSGKSISDWLKRKYSNKYQNYRG